MVVEVVQVMYGIATQIAMVLVTKILYFFIEFRISWKESYSVLVKMLNCVIITNCNSISWNNSSVSDSISISKNNRKSCYISLNSDNVDRMAGTSRNSRAHNLVEWAAVVIVLFRSYRTFFPRDVPIETFIVYPSKDNDTAIFTLL